MRTNMIILECGGKRSATPLLGEMRTAPKRCRRCALPPQSKSARLQWAVILSLWLASWLPTCGAAVAISENAFDSANKLYEQGKFSDAVSAYEKMIQSGSVSPALYFNLGNALFKSSRMGRAIAAYRQAEQLAPRDADVRANLQFARNQIQGPTQRPDRWQRWLGQLTVNEWTVLASVAFWLCLLSLMLGQIRPALKSALRSFASGSGIATCALCACLAVVLFAGSREIAIVTAHEAAVRNGPLDESQAAFPAHDGAELAVIDAKDDWLQVSAGQRTGWVKREQVVLFPARRVN